MSLVKLPIESLSIHFQTLDIPPPFSHFYLVRIDLMAAKPLVELEISYTEREQLTEEEILEEGFTPDDDFRWKGELPKTWKFATIEQLRKSKTLFDEPKPHAQQLLELNMTYQGDEQQQGIPNNAESWAYFAQELIQAIYELSHKEKPLEISYLEIGGQYRQMMRIHPSFSARKVSVRKEYQGQEQTKEHDWKLLKPLLEAIYLPDYHDEQALSEEPRQPGNYISPGDGHWYELGKAVTNPGEKKDAVGEMQQRIKAL